MKRCFLYSLLLVTLLTAHAAKAFVYAPLMLPMRDGTSLATDFYLPDDWETTPYPTLLIRTPYDKNNMMGMGAYADYGMVVVIQDTRGRFASEGTDSVFMSDGWGQLQDGADTCLWIEAFGVWYNERIVTWGGSALAILQYQLAGTGVQGLAGQLPMQGTPYLYEQLFYPGGVFRQADITSWLEGQGSSFHLINLRAHPTKDAYWQAVDLALSEHAITTPAIHMGGWFDLFSQGAIDAFGIYRHQHGAPHQYLVMGPWAHGLLQPEQNELTFPDNAAGYWDPDEEPIGQFLMMSLAGTLDDFDHPPVMYYVMGDVDDASAPGNQWRSADDWPPEAFTQVKLYLQPDTSLGVDVPEQTMPFYYYYPEDPTPSLCGLSLTFNPGPCDVSAYLQRDDVIYFETPVLEAPVEVTGRITVDLAFQSNRDDTDFTAFLVDVYPDGRHMLLLHGIQRASLSTSLETAAPLVPGTTSTLSVDLWSTSVVFNQGHRIGLFIASANYPMHEKNLNNFGQRPGETIWAQNTIVTGPQSALVLPVVGDVPWQPKPDDDDDDNDDDNDTGDDDSDDDDNDAGDDDASGDDDDDDRCCG